MIVGLGLDLCRIPRVAALVDRWGERFTRKLFTDGERGYCARMSTPAQHFAARFAAKEALLKALGVPDGLSWHEIEVRAGRPPSLALTGRAAEAAARLGVTRTFLTMTHDGDLAAAFVALEAAGRE